MPASGGSLAELGSSLPTEPWRVLQGSGHQLLFASVSDLSRAILAGQLDASDVLSRGLLPARRLGDVLELTSFFARARKPPTSERTPTLPGLNDPVQRAAVEHARAEIDRLQRQAAEEASAPPTDPIPPAAVLTEEPPSPALLELTPPPSVVFEPLPAATFATTPDEGSPRLQHGAAPSGSTTHMQTAATIPDAAVSPPQLPPLEELTDPYLHVAHAPPRRTREERLDDARRKRLTRGVTYLLAAAALVLIAGLGVRSLRTRDDHLTSARPPPSAAPVSVSLVPVPDAAQASIAVLDASVVPLEAASSVLAVAVPSGSASAEYHRGDPQHLSPVDPRRMVADGAHALRHGDLGKAEGAFQRAIDKNPYDSEALSGLADLARVRGQLDKARELYAQALSVNPNYLPALLALADLAWATGDRAEARKGYEHIIAHYPQAAYPARVKRRLAEEVPE